MSQTTRYLKALAKEVGFTDADVGVFRPKQCINTFARGASSLSGGTVQNEGEQSFDRATGAATQLAATFKCLFHVLLLTRDNSLFHSFRSHTLYLFLQACSTQTWSPSSSRTSAAAGCSC